MKTDPGIAELLGQLRDDTITLIKDEVALAKTEMAERVQRFSRNAMTIVAGALVGSSALLLLLFALGYWLTDVFLQREVNPGAAAGLGFLVAAGIAATTSALLVVKGIKALSASSLAPERTARSLREDKQWAKEKLP
jgi:hypothetical protein